MITTNSYKDLYNKVGIGDIIFFKPNMLYQRIVGSVSKGYTVPYWHVSVVVGKMHNRFILGESSLATDVDFIDLETRIIKTKIKEFTLVKLNIDKQQKLIIIQYLLDRMGKLYDKKALVNFLFGKPSFGSQDKYFCSDIIFRGVCEALKIKDLDYTYSKVISPEHLFLFLLPLMKKILDIKVIKTKGKESNIGLSYVYKGL